ncbi:MAG: hypothetical protein A2677_02670 [Candidatus Komeilibacteria bacterium RIFCSPHIGHO2_01_FULL_52_14]|uniref:HTH cro/C1-type domain-containing protein n=1 Tax=Candidatus Komeilibacteria bacterium RIFCSPHIGHO2_01_FULL_52_14 TaxID=1798549 RepID=A0A1G2BL13_9BACT|nr:MAG: hypothetical protein A2677_02670 [Candidatus Komeilibacteria bacterium RIFCSPHIGHO2_01_FULL_52_14]
MAPTFKKTQIGLYATVGEQIRAARESQKKTLAECAQELSIQERYLAAIESSQFSIIPGDLYARAWIRKYAAAVGLVPDHVMISYDRERKAHTKFAPHKETAQPPHRLVWEFLTLRRIVAILIVLTVIGYAAYIGYQTLKPPRVDLSIPTTGFQTHENSIIIRGQTETDVSVFINKERIVLDARQQFSEEIILHEGLNTVLIEARKKHSFPFVQEIPIINSGLEQPQTGS